MSDNFNDKFYEKVIREIKKSYICYINDNYSSRSQKSPNIIHELLAEFLQLLIDNIDDISIEDKSHLKIRTAKNDGEYHFKSEIHEKKFDITLVYSSAEGSKTFNVPILAISFKMPLSSVNKNLKNYFEMNIGDTTLVKECGTPFYFFMLLDDNSMQTHGKDIEIEKISNKSMLPFTKILNAKKYSNYKPNLSVILKVNYDDFNYKKESNSRSKLETQANVHKEIIKNCCPEICFLSKSGE